MKTFTCSKSDIAPSVNRCARTVPNRPSVEILQCLKMQVSKNGACIITASDMESEVMCKCQIDPIPKGFSFCLPAKKLDTLLNSLPGDAQLSFSIVKEGNREMMKLSSGTAEFSLAVWPASDYPSTNKLDKGTKLKLNCQYLSKMLSVVSPMMANNDVRYYLNGIKMELEESTINLVATDGHRMSVYNAALDSEHNLAKTECILPRQAVSEIASLLPMLSDEECDLVIYQSHCRVITNSLVITTKLIDGRFPEWRRVLPNTNNVMTVDKNHFISVLRRAVVLSDEKAKGVQIEFGQSDIKVSSTNKNHEKGHESMPAQFQSESSHTTGFNVNYLLDAVNNLEGPTVEFQFVTDQANTACILTSEYSPEVINTVMPVRL